jgi:patatin-like phospholipase
MPATRKEFPKRGHSNKPVPVESTKEASLMRVFTRSAAITALTCLAVSAFMVARLPVEPWPVRAEAQAKKQTKQQAKQPAAKKGPAAKGAPAVQPATAERTRFTSDDEAAAVVLGMPEARAWGDSEDEFARLLPKVNGPWLAMSGGGSDGAFSAGLITGLTQGGKRPDFAMVSGASIGALIGPYVFLGPRYDDKLRDLFSTIIAGDIFEDRATGQSLMDSWPLKRTIERRVTPELLADVATEYKAGRRLLTVTTNMDAGRRVIWNMGAIAERGDDKALKLFRDVLLASASIPGIFPPVPIEIEANGRTLQELHNDGSITAPFFLAPESVLAGTASISLPTHQFYVIANAKLNPQFEMAYPQTTALLGRSIGLALQFGLRAEILLTMTAAQRMGMELNVAHIPAEFQHAARGTFDPDYMRALFDFAAEQAQKGTAFETVAGGGGAELRGGVTR